MKLSYGVIDNCFIKELKQVVEFLCQCFLANVPEKDQDGNILVWFEEGVQDVIYIKTDLRQALPGLDLENIEISPLKINGETYWKIWVY